MIWTKKQKLTDFLSRAEIRVCKDGHRRHVVRARTDDEVHQLFLSRIKKDEATGCWNWTGCTAGWHPQRQYGIISFHGKSRGAHRYSYEFFNHTKIPADLMCRHKCDNTRCVNPDHIVIGTAKDNAQDCISRGRFVCAPKKCGESNHGCKISARSVLLAVELAGSGLPRKEIAAASGLSVLNVGLILNGRTWSHLTGIPKKVSTHSSDFRLTGSSHPNVKFTEEMVLMVPRLRSAGNTHSQIASLTGIPRGSVGAILYGKSWSSLTGIKPRVQ